MDSLDEETVSEYRSDLCMTSIGEFLIICGGDGDESGIDYSDLWCYNTINGAWKQYEIPVLSRDIHVDRRICANENLLYIMSQESREDDFRQIFSLVSFNVANATFNTLYTRPFDSYDDTPPPMVFSLFFSHNGSVYVMGRRASEDDDEDDDFEVIYKFCPVSSTWLLVPQNGTRLNVINKIYCTVHNNQLYVFVHNFLVSNLLREVMIFDFLTMTWTIRATSPKISCTLSFCLYALEWFKVNESFEPGAFQHYWAVINDSFLYNFDGVVNKVGSLNKLERFMVWPPSLYRLSLESVCRLPNARDHIKSLPPSIVDDLKLDDNNSSLDD
ncbi:hypothetical protein RF11_04572 [Thelohanellus kitauei]|uniref:Kelch domain-containing protein 10 n=1 Tax=Thelohanellus kitauei TaxID=669202 RepID=A0A0C2IF05_THEKT|nr:hypothetical protein RF11_04572 [Thelohanellus kitauei]